MWSYYPELLATPVPRYTSFPTAAEFGDNVGAAELEPALQDLSGDVSLYVHIPFCEKICWYCGCNTGAANRRDRLTRYLDALHREIAMVGGLFENRVRARRIAFGGGSPNAIAPTDMVRLVTAMTQLLPLAGKRVDVCEYPDGSLEIRHCDHVLPYRVFDKIRQVNQAAIVENKHLDAALMMAKLMQEQLTPRKRNNNEPGRRSQGAHMFAVPELGAVLPVKRKRGRHPLRQLTPARRSNAGWSWRARADCRAAGPGALLRARNMSTSEQASHDTQMKLFEIHDKQAMISTKQS